MVSVARISGFCPTVGCEFRMLVTFGLVIRLTLRHRPVYVHQRNPRMPVTLC